MTDFLWIIFFLSYFVVLNKAVLTVPFGSFINIYATQITIARAMTESPRKPSFIISAGDGEKYSDLISREFDTSFQTAHARYIGITPLAVNFFVKFYDFVSACWCLL